jgi:hypothetical protein
VTRLFLREPELAGIAADVGETAAVVVLVLDVDTERRVMA